MTHGELRVCHTCGKRRPVSEMCYVEVRIYNPPRGEGGFCCVGACAANYLRSIAQAGLQAYAQQRKGAAS